MHRNKRAGAMLLVAAILLVVIGFAVASEAPSELAEYGLQTDTTKSTIGVSTLVSGGVAKGGIPALVPRVLVPAAESAIPSDTMGVLVDLSGEQRFYPDYIMARHEVANDRIREVPIAVTYSTLAGSSAVYDRRVAGQVLEFGISGLLHESNTLLYDLATESLWSQSTGAAVVGDFVGDRLELVGSHVLSLAQVRELYPEALVVSEQTGFGFDYSQLPYEGYLETDELVTPVSRQDPRYPNKAPMVLFRIEDGPVVGVPLESLPSQEASAEIDGRDVTLRVEGPVISVFVDGEGVPTYREMWFSFIAQNGDAAELWVPED